MLFLWDPRSPLLPLLAADRIVTGEALGPAWPVLYDQDGVRIYHYPAALPRAFVTSSWRTEPEDSTLVRGMLRLANAGRLGDDALLEGPVSHHVGSDQGSPADVQDVSPNELRVTLPRRTVSAKRRVISGVLVVLDNYHPGWYKTADDDDPEADTRSPSPIRRADLTFRGIPVVGGTRSIRLRYEPATFRIGLFLASLAIAWIAAICAAASGAKATALQGSGIRAASAGG
jgi:hypothetical protein